MPRPLAARRGCVRSCTLALTLVAATFVAAAAPGWTEEAHPDLLTPETIVAMRSIRDLAVSPDGQWIAYVLQVPRGLDEERGSPYLEIWLVDRNGRRARQFTPSKQRAWAPAFSPDGTQIAFLSTRQLPTATKDDTDKDKARLFRIPMTGGEASAVTTGEHSVSSFRWSPTGETIAFTATAPVSAEKKDARKKGRDWIDADVELVPTHLWSVRLADGSVTRLTQTDVNVWDFDWAPDGKRFVLRVTDTPRIDAGYMQSRLALMPAAGGDPAAFVPTVGKLEGPRFSPDGSHVAWLGATSANDPFPGTVFVASIAGGTPHALTTTEPGCATAVDWVDASTLLYAASRGTATALVTVSRSGGRPRDALTHGPIFAGFTLAPDGKSLALVGDTPTHPGEIFAAGFARSGMRLRRLTVTNPAVEKMPLGAQEVVRWASGDGLEIEGVLVRPVGYSEGVRYPLVVMAHGGPEGCYRDGWNTSYSRWAQLLAQRGFMVLMPNFRGSIGRGEEFERGDHGDLAGKEFDDVLKGIDALVARGMVDGRRVGIGGGSYGGYFSAWAATAWSERFAAAVDFAGITNWHSMQGVSDIPLENSTVHWNLPYFDNTALYWERSPLAHVRKCQTPILIAHGDSDKRVPVGQGVELYTALRLLDREATLVRYPRAGHGLEESAHQNDFLTRVLDWYERNLKVPTTAASR